MTLCSEGTYVFRKPYSEPPMYGQKVVLPCSEGPVLRRSYIQNVFY